MQRSRILPAMPDESTPTNLVELTRRAYEAGSSGDVDLILRFYDPDAVWDMSKAGMGTFEGRAAIRGFFEDWTGSYEGYRIEAVEILDLGSGIVFCEAVQSGRPGGSDSDVRFRYATVITWADRLIVCVTNYFDIDEARAAAERLAQERG
jgi:ketosteroid isomerase-like protein